MARLQRMGQEAGAVHATPAPGARPGVHPTAPRIRADRSVGRTICALRRVQPQLPAVHRRAARSGRGDRPVGRPAERRPAGACRRAGAAIAAAHLRAPRSRFWSPTPPRRKSKRLPMRARPFRAAAMHPAGTYASVATCRAPPPLSIRSFVLAALRSPSLPRGERGTLQSPFYRYTFRFY
jgi:hypothetical protein